MSNLVEQVFNERSELAERVFRDGTLISLHCSWWKGQIGLSPEDLGLKREEVPELFSLGRKRLYPKSWFDLFMKLEQSTRKYIKDNSLIFPIPYVYFVTNNIVTTVIRELDRRRTEFNMLLASFLQKQESIKASMLDQYTSIARSRYSNEIEMPEEQFIELIVNHISHAYPGIPEIQSKFDMSYSLFAISSPNLSDEQSESAKRSFINETNVEEIMVANGERDRLTKEYQERMDTELNGFIADAVVQLRARVSDALESLRGSFKSKRSVSQKSMNNVRKVIEQFRNLNFMGDESIESILDNFKEEYLSTEAKVYRDNNVLAASFEHAISSIESDLKETSGVSKITGSYVRRLTL